MESGKPISASQQNTLVHSHSFTQRDTQTSTHFPSCHQNFLPAQFFKSLTCILLSFTLPPPLPVSPPPPPSLPLRFLSLVHRRVAITSPWPKCVTSLSLWLSPSLPLSLLLLFPYIPSCMSGHLSDFFYFLLHPLWEVKMLLTTFAIADLLSTITVWLSAVCSFIYMYVSPPLLP